MTLSFLFVNTPFFQIHEKGVPTIYTKKTLHKMAHLVDLAAKPEERLLLFYLLYAPDKTSMIPSILLAHSGREEMMYRKLEEKYGAWRFFEVWGALDAFYRAYSPAKLQGVMTLMRDWHPRGLEALLISLENRYSSRYFTDREMIPLNDGSKHRIAIEALYRRYDPTKIGCLGSLMGAYRGHEGELLGLLKLKYEGVDSLPPVPVASYPSTAHPLSLHNPYSSPVRHAPPPIIIDSRLSPRPPADMPLPSPPPPDIPDFAQLEQLHVLADGSNEWVPPSQGDWEALLSALKRKDSLIAKQTAAIQEQAGELREQKSRTGDALSVVPPLVHQGDVQREAIEQLHHVLAQKDVALQMSQQRDRGGLSMDAELSKQVCLLLRQEIL